MQRTPTFPTGSSKSPDAVHIAAPARSVAQSMSGSSKNKAPSCVVSITVLKAGADEDRANALGAKARRQLEEAQQQAREKSWDEVSSASAGPEDMHLDGSGQYLGTDIATFFGKDDWRCR